VAFESAGNFAACSRIQLADGLNASLIDLFLHDEALASHWT
jgi:hypothetical protein